DACDRYGFIVWAEIPYISSQSTNPDAHINCREQMKDLVFQNYNHASICFWGISNEITISGEKPGLVENHRDLHELIKSIDPTRLTTIAHVSMLGEDSELHNISDVESYNHYFGWYGGDYTQNETWLDAYHTKYPTRCLGISEYGAEGIITYQPDEAKCRDYSEAYQAEYHEHMARIIDERDYLWSTHVWNMFDFGCAARDEGGVSGRNNKGLVTLDRNIKKEAFYVYKAYWSKQPFVYVCGRRYAQRAHETTTIKIYSNLPEVTLYVNQQEVATLSGSKVFVFEDVALIEGFNHIKATANDVFDCLTLERVEEKPEIYTLVDDEGEIDTGLVANWFDQSAAEAANATLQFPEGYYSIKSTINELLDSPEASEFIVATFAAASGMKLKAAMLRMMGDKTLEGMMDMAASMGKDLPENMLLMVNMKLNTIEKIAK
ncbi:MAG: glycoside hydrolase family 2 TIM barrel-domain containing protein, partial [Erysipelotrichaceae bacterium]